MALTPQWGRLGRLARSAAAGVLVTVALAGCIRIEESVNFTAQGSGTYDLTYGMDRQALQDMASAMGDAFGATGTPTAGVSGGQGSGGGAGGLGTSRRWAM